MMSEELERVRHKPGSVLSMRGLVIYLGRLLPDASSGAQQRGRKKINHGLFDLAPNRGLPSQHLSMLLVRSYRTFAPLPVLNQALELRDLSPDLLWPSHRRYVSVALSSRSPALGVTQQV